MFLLLSPTLAQAGWSDKFLCTNKVGLKHSDPKVCEQFNVKAGTNVKALEVPIKADPGINPVAIAKPTNTRCLTPEQQELISSGILQMQQEYTACTDKATECESVANSCGSNLSYFVDENGTLKDLVELRESQLSSANERVVDLENGPWYDWVFYYGIPIVATGLAIYVGADMLSDTTHPFQ